METPNNILEKKWKTKILIENTPRGNILMHYDSFKNGFTYYSNASNIPYNILNAVAMKYVLLYRCRDFFLDNMIVPETKQSPFISLYKSNDLPSIPVTTTTTTKKKHTINNDVFAKLKTYNTVTSKLLSKENTKTIVEEEKEEKIYTRNTFIFAGKMNNFKILQSVKKPRAIHFESKLLSELSNTVELENPSFSYKDFKKMKETVNNL